MSCALMSSRSNVLDPIHFYRIHDWTRSQHTSFQDPNPIFSISGTQDRKIQEIYLIQAYIPKVRLLGGGGWNIKKSKTVLDVRLYREGRGR